MKRRDLLSSSSIVLANLALHRTGFASPATPIDAAWYRRSRRFATLSMGRIAYVELGPNHGPAALFLHGYPLNGFQWRGAIERLHRQRRCVVPDLMGLGFSEPREGQTITPATQVAMLVELLDSLNLKTVDLVANDSGGIVAQLFVAAHPERVRSLLLTNCDVDTNNPPPGFLPVAKLAEKGQFVDRALVPQLNDKQLARSVKGIGQVYTFPDRLSDEAIETYFRPLVETPLKKSQAEQYAVAMETNVLVAVREQLPQWKGPARMVWALKDTFFGVEWAEWLDRTLPGSRGVRRVEGANLFFPEEMPDLIAEEAAALWRVKP